MVVFEVRSRDAMILRMELSSIRSSPSFATGTMAWGAGAVGAGAGAVVLDFIEAASAAAAFASEEGLDGDLAGVVEAFWTSLLTMRPAGPVPVSPARLTPSSAAILRAKGEALSRSPREGVGAMADDAVAV